MESSRAEPAQVALPRGVYAIVVRETCGTVRRIVNALEHDAHVARALLLGERQLDSSARD